MGRAKEQQQNDEYKRQLAIQIAVKSGVLSTCKNHEDVIMDGDIDIENAYKLGNSQFTSGDISEVFDSRAEMTSIIQEVVDENSAGECYSCREWNEQ